MEEDDRSHDRVPSGMAVLQWSGPRTASGTTVRMAVHGRKAGCANTLGPRNLATCRLFNAVSSCYLGGISWLGFLERILGSTYL